MIYTDKDQKYLRFVLGYLRASGDGAVISLKDLFSSYCEAYEGSEGFEPIHFLRQVYWLDMMRPWSDMDVEEGTFIVKPETKELLFASIEAQMEEEVTGQYSSISVLDYSEGSHIRLNGVIAEKEAYMDRFEINPKLVDGRFVMLRQDDGFIDVTEGSMKLDWEPDLCGWWVYGEEFVCSTTEEAQAFIDSSGSDADTEIRVIEQRRSTPDDIDTDDIAEAMIEFGKELIFEGELGNDDGGVEFSDMTKSPYWEPFKILFGALIRDTADMSKCCCISTDNEVVLKPDRD